MRARGAGFALLCLVCVPGGAAAQTDARLAVLAEPDVAAVGLAVVLNAGGAWETSEEAGVTYLAALSIIEAARPSLERLGGTAAVVCDRANIGFTAVLPSGQWREGAELLLDHVFERQPDDAAVAVARGRLLGVLTVSEGSPSHEIRETTYQALFGPEHHWARAPCGHPAAIAAAGPEDVRRVARTRFLPSRATAAIAGPINEREGRELLRSALGEANLPLLLLPPPPAREGAERRVRRNTVTAWVALAFPTDAEPDTEALLLLASRISEAVAPAASRPDIYDLDIALERHGGGAALVVHLITAPERAERRAREVRSLVRDAATDLLPADRFADLLRRHRGKRLLSLDTPETRALDAAVQLFFASGYEPVTARLDALSAQTLRAAAAALGDPAIAVVGPS